MTTFASLSSCSHLLLIKPVHPVTRKLLQRLKVRVNNLGLPSVLPEVIADNLKPTVLSFAKGDPKAIRKRFKFKLRKSSESSFPFMSLRFSSPPKDRSTKSVNTLEQLRAFPTLFPSLPYAYTTYLRFPQTMVPMIRKDEKLRSQMFFGIENSIVFAKSEHLFDCAFTPITYGNRYPVAKGEGVIAYSERGTGYGNGDAPYTEGKVHGIRDGQKEKYNWVTNTMYTLVGAAVGPNFSVETLGKSFLESSAKLPSVIRSFAKGNLKPSHQRCKICYLPSVSEASNQVFYSPSTVLSLDKGNPKVITQKVLERKVKCNPRLYKAFASKMQLKRCQIDNIKSTTLLPFHFLHKVSPEFKEKIILQKSFIENEAIPCIPLEHQKTLQCTNSLVPLGALVSAGQEICEQSNEFSCFLLPKYLLSKSIGLPEVISPLLEGKTLPKFDGGKVQVKPYSFLPDSFYSYSYSKKVEEAPSVSKVLPSVTRIPLATAKLSHKVKASLQQRVKGCESKIQEVRHFSEDLKLRSPKNLKPYLGFKVSSKQANKMHRTRKKVLAYDMQTLATAESGQIIKIDTDKVTLRRAHCYLVYSQAFLSVVNNEYIKKGTALLSLKYEKLLTGDIVQGLGKIEELLESPKLSLNLSFKICLRRYLTKVSLDKAIQWSYGELQERLVQSVQQVYVDQGCFISDKHLEIIVRQATSLATILFPGDTGFLHHEVVLIDKIEKINKQVEASSSYPFTPFAIGDHPFTPVHRRCKGYGVRTEGANTSFLLSFAEGDPKAVNQKQSKSNPEMIQRQKAIYYPHLKGITWSSLNSDSILSAASFQETRRVLRDNLVTDKVDFLKGIKERIILGELLAMGTGFFKNHF